jgi:tetratricopeptide (TPR) repeat protein
MNIRPIGSLAIALPLFAGISLFGKSPTKLKTPTTEQLKSAADKGDWRACNNYAVKNLPQAFEYLRKGERFFLEKYDTDNNSILSKKEHKALPKNLQTEYPLLFFNLGTLYRKKQDFKKAGRCLLIASQPDSLVALSARNDYGVLLEKGLIEPLVEWDDFSFFGFITPTEEEKNSPKGKPGQIPLKKALKSKLSNKQASDLPIYNLGLSYLETDPRHAGDLIRQAIVLNPKLPPLKPVQTQAEINYGIGRTKLEQGKLEEAITYLNGALKESKKRRHSTDATIEAEIMKLAKQLAQAEGKSLHKPKESFYIKQIKSLFLNDSRTEPMYPESNIYLCYAFFLRIENNLGDSDLLIHSYKRTANLSYDRVNKNIADGPNHKSTWEEIKRMNLKHRHVPHPRDTLQPIRPDTTGIFFPTKKELNSMVGGLINDGLDYMNYQKYKLAIDKFKQAEGHPEKALAQTQKIHNYLASAYYQLRSQRMKIGRKLEKEEEKELLDYALKAAARGDLSSKWFVVDIQQKWSRWKKKDPNYKNYLKAAAMDFAPGGSNWEKANELYKYLVVETKKPFHLPEDKRDLKNYLLSLKKDHSLVKKYPFINDGLSRLDGTRP